MAHVLLVRTPRMLVDFRDPTARARQTSGNRTRIRMRPRQRARRVARALKISAQIDKAGIVSSMLGEQEITAANQIIAQRYRRIDGSAQRFAFHQPSEGFDGNRGIAQPGQGTSRTPELRIHRRKRRISARNQSEQDACTAQRLARLMHTAMRVARGRGQCRIGRSYLLDARIVQRLGEHIRRDTPRSNPERAGSMPSAGGPAHICPARVPDSVIF